MSSLLALSLLGGGSIAHAADSIAEPENLQPQLPQFSMQAKSFQFPSGLRVIMQPDHSAPIVALTTYIDHGSRSDPKGKEGIAHFLEHMWFKSRHIEGSEVETWDVLQDSGCALNASTSMDWTNYMTVCPKSALPTLMKFASLRLTDTVKGVQPEEADSEREVIRNELRMRSEGWFEARNYYQYALKSLFPPDHPYNRLGIGTHDSLDNVTLDDIAKFAEDYYRPEETTIVVVGDFEPEDAGSLIIEHFDLELLHPDLTEDHIRMAPRPGVSVDEIDPKNPDPTKVFYVAMDPANPRRPLDIEGNEPIDRSKQFGMPAGDPHSRELMTYQAPVSQTAAVVAWALPAGYKGQDIVAYLASGQVSGQLFLNFRDEYDVVKDEFGRPQTRCQYQPFQENSLMYCFTQVKKGRNAARWADKMLDQLMDIWNPERLANPIVRQSNERNFGMARNGYLRDTLTSMDRVSGIGGNARATALGAHAHHTGDHRYYSTALNTFGQVELSQIMGFLQQYVTRERAARFVLEPLPEDDLVLDSSESDYAGADADADQVVSLVPDDAITPELIEEQVVTPDFDKVLDRTLSNGLRVVVYPHGEAPLASIRLVSQGGSDSDLRATDAIIDVLTAGGRADLEPLRIAGDWADGDAGTFTWLGMDVPSGNADEAIWYLRSRVGDIKRDFDGKGSYIRFRKDRVLGQYKSNGWWRSRLTQAALGPLDHPAFSSWGYEEWEWLKKLKKPDVDAYIAQKYHPKNMTLVAVGAFDPEEVYEAAERYFSGWSTDVAHEPMPSPGETAIPTHEPLYYVVNEERRTQTQVDAYCRLANGGAETRAHRDVLDTIANGFVFSELRKREGIAYSPGAGVQERVGGNNTLIMTGLFQNDAVGIATNTFLRIANAAETGDLPMTRFKSAQLSLSRKPVLGLQAIGDVATNFTLAVGRGWTFDEWGSYGEQLASTTPEDVNAVLEPCADSFVVTYTGPEEVIGPVLEEAGIDYEVINGLQRSLEMYDQYSKRDAKKTRKAIEKQAEAEAEAEAKDAGDSEESEED